MARSMTLHATAERYYGSEGGARADFQILIERLKRQADENDVDPILWDTMVLSTEVNEVDDRSLTGVNSVTEYIIWTAKVTGVIVDD